MRATFASFFVGSAVLTIAGCAQRPSPPEASQPRQGQPVNSPPVKPSESTVTPRVTSLGMNLSSIVDWSSEWPFCDAFKTSRPWIESGEGPFTYDDGGNPLLRPGQQLETLI